MILYCLYTYLYSQDRFISIFRYLILVRMRWGLNGILKVAVVFLSNKLNILIWPWERISTDGTTTS